MGWVHAYWAWVGGNIGAMPLEFAITIVATGVFRKPIARAVKWFREETTAGLHEHLAELHDELRSLRESHDRMRAKMFPEGYAEGGGVHDHDAGFGERSGAP